MAEQQSYLLIFGRAGAVRNEIELRVFRNGLQALCAEECEEAVNILRDHQIDRLLILTDADNNATKALLSQIGRTVSRVPVFYLAASTRSDFEWANVQDPNSYSVVSTVDSFLLSANFPSGSREESAQNPREVKLVRNRYPTDYRLAVSAFEAEWLQKVLDLCRGNVSRTAELIGLVRRSVQLKVQKHRLKGQRPTPDGAQNPMPD